MATLTMALLTMALLTMAMLTMGFPVGFASTSVRQIALTMAVPTMASLTMPILTMASLTMAILTRRGGHGQALQGGGDQQERGAPILRVRKEGTAWCTA